MDVYKTSEMKYLVACGCANHSVRVWEKENEDPIILSFNEEPSKAIVIDVSFSPNGQYLAAINQFGLVAVWTMNWSRVFSQQVAGRAVYKSLTWNSSSSKLAVSNLTQQVHLMSFKQRC
jgi:WD40 repeat protein